MKIRSFLLVTFLAALVLVAAPPDAAAFRMQGTAREDATYEPVYARLKRFIPEVMKKNRITGLSIALVDDRGLIWAHGFGYADAARRIPAAPETIYRAGSITKPLTAIAVLQLAEQGKIGIDRPFSDCLPEFDIQSRFEDTGPITLRNILTHHSGLPSDWLGMMWNENPMPFDSLAASLRDEYVAYPPGLVFSYSNVGYTLLGHAVQEIAGLEYASYMKSAVLEPLGMMNSSFSPDALSGPEFARGYRNGREASEPPILLPAGGLQSTVLDLGRLIRMVLSDGMIEGRRILLPETVSEMVKPQNEGVPLDADVRIGLGWLLGGQGLNYAGRMAQHGGSTLLFFSQLSILLDHKLGVVVMGNSSGAAGVVEEISQEALRAALKAKAGISPPVAPETAVLSTLSVEKLRRYEATYATAMGLFQVKAGKGGLKSRLSGQPILLKPQSDGSFTPRFLLLGTIPIHVPQLAGIRFLFDDIAGRRVLLMEKAGDRTLLGERIVRTPISSRWAGRVGPYVPVNLGDNAGVWMKDARLRLEDGWLVMSVTHATAGLQEFALKPLSDTEAVALGLGRNMGQTLRVKTSNGEERLLFSGCEFSRMTN